MKPKDERIELISDERPNDGVFVYLKPGFWNWMDETHFIVGDDYLSIVSQLKASVEPCNCEECKELKKEQK